MTGKSEMLKRRDNTWLDDVDELERKSKTFGKNTTKDKFGQEKLNWVSPAKYNRSNKAKAKEKWCGVVKSKNVKVNSNGKERKTWNSRCGTDVGVFEQVRKKGRHFGAGTISKGSKVWPNNGDSRNNNNVTNVLTASYTFNSVEKKTLSGDKQLEEKEMQIPVLKTIAMNEDKPTCIKIVKEEYVDMEEDYVTKWDYMVKNEYVTLDDYMTKVKDENMTMDGYITEIKDENMTMDGYITKVKDENMAMDDYITKVKDENMIMANDITKVKDENMTMGDYITKVKDENMTMDDYITKVKDEYEEKLDVKNISSSSVCKANNYKDDNIEAEMTEDSNCGESAETLLLDFLDLTKSIKCDKVSDLERDKIDESPSFLKGWTREERIRQSGNSAGKVDVYYKSPQGKRIRSKRELFRFFGGQCDLSMVSFRQTKFQ